MIKKRIINDPVRYVKLKGIGLRIDYYFNRKGCNNKERGHLAIEDGKVVCERPASALNVFISNGSPFLNISGALILPI
ncbi:MAG: hypothetical protein KJ718_02615 [Nanoarchaeota archaeon]|nr:hypothetical protein [Nanoarchaeota archaeon]MBU1051422.1 hypothetical protein [Nanoarchaeota archaeon]MBU1988201.1 hypothetical protein [Nanoarchaeota archaeon]